jgi:dolichol kinase
MGWCGPCRAVVIRRATLAGRLAGIVGSFAVGYWIFGVMNPDPRFLMVWILLVAAVYGFLYKIVQRVSFEIIRSRGVPPPTEV